MAKKQKIVLKSAVEFVTIGPSSSFQFSGDGIEMSSSDMAAFNAALEKLGYKAIQTTFNLMNEKAGTFVIDADTPWCCNPRSETYQSM